MPGTPTSGIPLDPIAAGLLIIIAMSVGIWYALHDRH